MCKGLVISYRKKGGGPTKRKGEQVKFYPCEKRRGGGGKSLSHAKGGGGHNKFWDSFNMGA